MEEIAGKYDLNLADAYAAMAYYHDHRSEIDGSIETDEAFAEAFGCNNPLIDATLMAAILDSLKDPLLFADTEHITRYMNKAAIAYYSEGESLLGRSLLDCHNEQSQQQIIEILAAMQAGEEERLITDNEEHRIYMRAVRGADGQVLGYYERYEPPAKGTMDRED